MKSTKSTKSIKSTSRKTKRAKAASRPKSAPRRTSKRAVTKRGKTPARKPAAAATKRRTRRPPGESGRGDYFRIAIRSKTGFVAFRTQDVGDVGHVQRLAGKRHNGTWDTITWLISKRDAHLDGRHLIADTDDARKVLAELGSAPVHVRGDVFAAKPPPNVPETGTMSEPKPAAPRVSRINLQKARALQTTRRRTPGLILHG